MKTKKILVATELDELSENVTEFAISVAKQLSISEIVLLNVIKPVHPQSFSATGDGQLSDGQRIDRFNAELMRKHLTLVESEANKFSTDKVMIKAYVRFNDSKTDLNDYIEYFNAGLVVFGSRDEDNFLNQIFGIDSEELVRKIDYPAIILKDKTNFGVIKDILVAIDVSENDQSGLKDIAQFAEFTEAKMHLLHVVIDGEVSPDDSVEKLSNLAKEYELANYTINVVNNTNLEDGIKSFVRKNSPDMIAVQSQGKGKIRKLIFGSGTQNIIKEVDKPVFVSKIS
ncbi:MAG: universal stress protein [Bacteroidales bacterium]